jgi:hypothetical protein
MNPIYRRFSRYGLAFFLIWNAALPVRGQQPRTAEAFRTQDRIRLDGKLDEPAWQSAAPVGRLVQRTPKEGEPPTEDTEIRVLVDDQIVYFGIVCYDRTPADIVANQMTRDAVLDADDRVLVIVDPFFDHRNGFFFEVNPNGARADGQVGNNAEGRSYEWDGIWNASARITAQGWVVEIAIPFKTLRFKPGQDVWGLNVERQIKRWNETDRWAGARRDVWISNLSEAGQLKGMKVAHQGRGIDIRPFLTAGRENGAGKLDGGLDVSKNLTPNLNASLTVNTDFAETEVDARQVNLTRFPLFYPEKRTFFLEGAGVFDIAGLTGWHRDLIPFFSRRVGLLSDIDRTVPILAGTKVIGRLSNYNVGILDVQTRRVSDLNLGGQNLLAARISRNLFRQSSIGAIFTRGNPLGTGDNTLIGGDARFATSQFRGGKNLEFDAYMLRTDDQATGKSDYAGGIRLDYPNDLWDCSMSWKQIGNNFLPALGFVPRAGIRKSTGGISYKPRPERFGIRQLQFEFHPEVITDLDNVVQNWSFEMVPLNFEMESGDHLEFNASPQFERLEEPFEITPGVVLPIGSYQWTRYRAQVETASKRRWVLSLAGGGGGFYDGTMRELEAGLEIKPSHHIALSLQANRNDVRLAQGRFFTQIFTAQANFNFSPNVSWANLVQYDNESRILGVQSRFRWILKPGNDLFLVINRGWIRGLDGAYNSNYDRATVKLQYTFRY